jgi:hypothetical protein
MFKIETEPEKIPTILRSKQHHPHLNFLNNSSNVPASAFAVRQILLKHESGQFTIMVSILQWFPFSGKEQAKVLMLVSKALQDPAPLPLHSTLCLRDEAVGKTFRGG